MRGGAKKKYLELEGKVPFWPLEPVQTAWPLLDRLVDQGELDYIDQRFAAAFAKRGLKSEQGALVLAYCFWAAREGHLCVNLEEILPRPPWSENFNALLQQGVEEVLNLDILKAKGPLLYLPRHFEIEEIILEKVQHIAQGPKRSDDFPFLFDNLESEQKEGLQKAWREPLCFITGGPGTGKTFLATALARASEKAFRVTMAAPTGKATSNLKEKVGEKYKIATLHALLFGNQRKFLIDTDLLIIDESSMIDASLFAKLLTSIHSKTRLVFFGDPAQLPPVEGGQVFSDLVLKEKERVVELKTVLRTDKREILYLAECVKAGRREEFAQLYDRGGEGAVTLAPLPDRSKILQIAMSHLDTSFRILTPLREGSYGVARLNSLLHERLMQEKKKIPLPILITANDTRSGLANGDLGVLWEGRGYFPGEKVLSSLLLPSYEIAFFLSVHKSQGSEFDEVVVILPEGSVRFGREMLYTAITRARSKITLLGDRQTILEILSKKTERISGIYFHSGKSSSSPSS